MAMRSYIELYIHDNETNPGKKSLRMSVKSPPPHQKRWEAAISLSARGLREELEESLRS